MSEFVIDDIDGSPIHEGDEVFAFAQEFRSTLIDDSGGIPVYEEDASKPLPVKDVPLFRGIVEWSADQLAYLIRISWVCPQWGLAPSTIGMGGGSYVYQKAA